MHVYSQTHANVPPICKSKLQVLTWWFREQVTRYDSKSDGARSGLCPRAVTAQAGEQCQEVRKMGSNAAESRFYIDYTLNYM